MNWPRFRKTNVIGGFQIHIIRFEYISWNTHRKKENKMNHWCCGSGTIVREQQNTNELTRKCKKKKCSNQGWKNDTNAGEGQKGLNNNKDNRGKIMRNHTINYLSKRYNTYKSVCKCTYKV